MQALLSAVVCVPPTSTVENEAGRISGRRTNARYRQPKPKTVYKNSEYMYGISGHCDNNRESALGSLESKKSWAQRRGRSGICLFFAPRLCKRQRTENTMITYTSNHILRQDTTSSQPRSRSIGHQLHFQAEPSFSMLIAYS
jgi:hypothetical protein